MKRENTQLSSTQDLLNFYNRYLSIENDDQDLLALISKLGRSFTAKLTDNVTLKEILNHTLQYQKEDFRNLNYLQLSCIKFYTSAVIEIDEDLYVTIDSFGKIVELHVKKPQDVAKSIGTSVLDITDISKKAQKDVKNVIIQNILVSKIYKAIYEALLNQDELAAQIFKTTNEAFISYEEKLNEVFDLKKCLESSFGRTKSPK